MYKIIYMKADFEPWWQFEGWEEYIVSEQVFDCKEDYDRALQLQFETFRQLYDHEQSKDEIYYAFWSDDEKEYCEACEDDAQIYHGLVLYSDSYMLAQGKK